MSQNKNIGNCSRCPFFKTCLIAACPILFKENACPSYHILDGREHDFSGDFLSILNFLENCNLVSSLEADMHRDYTNHAKKIFTIPAKDYGPIDDLINSAFLKHSGIGKAVVQKDKRNKLPYAEELNLLYDAQKQLDDANKMLEAAKKQSKEIDKFIAETNWLFEPTPRQTSKVISIDSYKQKNTISLKAKGQKAIIKKISQ